MKIIGLPGKYADDYIALLSKIESNDNPNAKAKTSSASGRFQFIKSTWEGLGYDWKDVFNDKLQYEAAEKFTNQNARALQQAGCAINFATLYGSHFLGLAGFLKIMRAAGPGTPIEAVTTAAQRKANPTILKGTVGDFGAWLKRKTGDDYTKRYSETGWTSGDGVIVPPAPETPKGGINVGAVIFIIFALAVAGAITYFLGGK